MDMSPAQRFFSCQGRHDAKEEFGHVRRLPNHWWIEAPLFLLAAAALGVAFAKKCSSVKIRWHFDRMVTRSLPVTNILGGRGLHLVGSFVNRLDLAGFLLAEAKLHSVLQTLCKEAVRQ